VDWIEHEQDWLKSGFSVYGVLSSGSNTREWVTVEISFSKEGILFHIEINKGEVIGLHIVIFVYF
jgi:hypothetical protein